MAVLGHMSLVRPLFLGLSTMMVDTRPEIGFVGKAPGTYMMLLGGGYYGQRLNKIYRGWPSITMSSIVCSLNRHFFAESVTEPDILAILKPMIKRYALERLDGERFGNFVIRVGYISPVREGESWYDGAGGEAPYREIAV